MQTVQDLHNASNAENDKRVGEVFRTMLGFTVLMVLGPIGTYFFTKNYIWESKLLFYYNYRTKLYEINFSFCIKDYFEISKESSYIYSAISAVVVVHVIVGAFIYCAWKDAFHAAKQKKEE